MNEDPFADIELSSRDAGGASAKKAKPTAMKVAASPVPTVDANGDAIPEHLVEKWHEDTIVAKGLAKQCSQLQTAVRKTSLANLDKASKSNMVSSLATWSKHLRRVCVPHKLCPACKGAESDFCNNCGTVGYVGVER